MSTVTVTQNVQTDKKIKDKFKNLEQATTSSDLDEVIKKVKKIDNTCSFVKCKTKVSDFSINCKYCSNRFCTAHGLPEIHGCGDAVRRDERRKFLHPNDSKLSQDKHDQASVKLTQKLKQLQLDRKSKQGYQSKGKGK